jgi:preprotein translocase subunit SecD
MIRCFAVALCGWVLAACAVERNLPATPDPAASAPAHVQLGIYPVASQMRHQYRLMTDPGGSSCYVAPQAILSAADVVSAEVGEDAGGNAGVLVSFGYQGSRRLQEYTSSHQGERLALVIDDRLIMAPRIVCPLSSALLISGNLDPHTPAELAAALSPKNLR